MKELYALYSAEIRRFFGRETAQSFRITPLVENLLNCLHAEMHLERKKTLKIKMQDLLLKAKN
jgi:hypothetical protein